MRNRKLNMIGILLMLSLNVGAQGSNSSFDNLVWSDEFEIDGPVDNSKWFHQTQIPNGNSWFNGEIQHYTDRTENAVVEDGVLKIIAQRENYTDQGVTKSFTSARLNSKFAFTYGKIEIRAKLPSGIGTWPALWMLGKNINENGAYWQQEGYGTTGWPACGEIDIMEHWGHNQDFVQSAIHAPVSFGNTFNKGGQLIDSVSTKFHVYSLEWTPDEMIFAVDGNTHYTYKPNVKDSRTWPFDEDAYLLFNVAILPSIEASFTSSAMEVDYVRIYQESPLSIIEKEENANITIFPNPFNSDLIVKFQEVGNQLLKINIYNTEGKLMDTTKLRLTSNEIKVNKLNQLEPGLYIIRLDGEDFNHTIKLVKH
ncbi:MAG: family 16 glycosylhydrolase [Saprospiraceae bacterium]|nr:family 16 glycosylhydrolase [Saprospiraceae bacterium]